MVARVKHAPSDYARWGKLGAKWGTFGAEYGRLGGRPRLIDKVGGLVAGTSNRKKLSYKQKRDDSFGVLARIEVCDIFHELWPAFEKAGKCKDDLYFYLRDEMQRPKGKIEFAVKNETFWRAEKKRLQLGKGTKGTLRCQGVRWATLRD